MLALAVVLDVVSLVLAVSDFMSVTICLTAILHRIVARCGVLLYL